MMHEEKKIAKIIEELTMFFFSIEAEEIHSGIQRKGKQVEIKLEARYPGEYDDSIDTLEKYLNEPKNEGIEDIYWELAGSGDPGESSQLLLVGMMIDEAQIIRQSGYTKLILQKTLKENN